jgi:ABC-type bacteriocin/lantibiotic exporter with double-glycine peptidase domain
MSFRRVAALALSLAVLVGAGAVARAATTALWLDVPFVPQPLEGCGAAVISMVLQYWSKQDPRIPNEKADVAHIHAALYSRKSGGILASSMVDYFERNGYRTFAIRGEWDDLEHHIKLGRPLVVALAPRGLGRSLHYAVVSGTDSSRRYVFLNDPARGKLMRISRETFTAEWKGAGNWMLLALPWPAD